MRRVVRVQALAGYQLAVTFDDGMAGTVGLSDLVGDGVFACWSNHQAFEQVRIGSSGELVWPDGPDLCPDALYLRLTGMTPEELFPALRHEAARA
jgi:hypothetical protein